MVACSAWCLKTFGTVRRPLPPLGHICEVWRHCSRATTALWPLGAQLDLVFGAQTAMVSCASKFTNCMFAQWGHMLGWFGLRLCTQRSRVCLTRRILQPWESCEHPDSTAFFVSQIQFFRRPGDYCVLLTVSRSPVPRETLVHSERWRACRASPRPWPSRTNWPCWRIVPKRRKSKS